MEDSSTRVLTSKPRRGRGRSRGICRRRLRSSGFLRGEGGIQNLRKSSAGQSDSLLPELESCRRVRSIHRKGTMSYTNR